MLYVVVEIILQQVVEFQPGIQGFLTNLSAFKESKGHPSKVAKLPKMSLRAEDMEHLNNL